MLSVYQLDHPSRYQARQKGDAQNPKEAHHRRILLFRGTRPHQIFTSTQIAFQSIAHVSTRQSHEQIFQAIENKIEMPL